MATTPLAQRMYDKTRADASAFRAELAEWHLGLAQGSAVYAGSTVDAFWQNARLHLQKMIAEYFEWVEREAATLRPSSLKRDSVDQCVGAIVSYGRQIRQITIETNRKLQKLETGIDLGRWEDLDDSYILARGQRLLNAFGVGSEVRLSERFNHIVSDHPWFFNVLTIASFVISLISFVISMIVLRRP